MRHLLKWNLTKGEEEENREAIINPENGLEV
jgi:hypothetical protein